MKINGIIFILALLWPAVSQARVLSCDSEIWSPETCRPFIQAFETDPYSYLSHTIKTVSAAKIAIVSGANRGKVPLWNSQFWNIVDRASELTGYIESQIDDRELIRVIDPSNKQVFETSIFSGCYYMRDDVAPEDVPKCTAFLEPAARKFYLAMNAYEAICGETEIASACPALKDFY